jgi:lipoprotein signal peptidase
MKKGTFYTLALLLLAAFSLDSCKKDLTLKTLPATHGTVSTVATGLYDDIATDNSGNIYALRTGTVDTIYKIDSLGNKSLFYTPAVTMDHDTAVIHTMSCLTIDSVGNLYTISFNGNKPKDVLKISAAGSATTLYSAISPGGGISIEQIAVNQGNFYFSSGTGIYKIAPGGSPSLLLTPKSGVFAVDRNGVLYYPVIDGITGMTTLGQLSASGTQTTISAITLDDVGSMTTDAAGNIYTSELSADGKAEIHAINAAKTTKTTIISSTFGHVDGPIATAKIGVAFSLITNSAGSLYFSEVTGNPNDIRRISL